MAPMSFRTMKHNHNQLRQHVEDIAHRLQPTSMQPSKCLLANIHHTGVNVTGTWLWWQ
jgi:hypothetical protein